MLKTIIIHELKNVISSPKFYTTFIIISVLILLSIIIGIQHYQHSVGQYETINRLVSQELREKTDWMSLNSKIHRKPDPFQIFISGANDDIGRYSAINSFRNVKLVHSNYSDDSIYAFFRFIDFGFIVTVILSLFAILFTYDAINGEAERGTLKLIFSNVVSRKTFITGKFTGTWLGLVVPVLLPLLLSILLLLLWNIPLTSEHWIKFLLLMFSSLLLYTFFIALGLFTSTVTKRSNVSFLASLVMWIMFVFVIPRSGIAAAGQMVKVPGFAEIQGKLAAFEKDRWEKYITESQARWRERNLITRSMSDQESRIYRDSKMWEWMEEEDKERKKIQTDLDAYSKKLNQDYNNNKSVQEKLGYSLSRLSPVSSYNLANMNIAGTDIGLKQRYEDALTNYRTTFVDYKDKKQKESGSHSGIRISVDSETGVKIETARDLGSLNLSDMPKFAYPLYSLNNARQTSIIDFGLICFFSLLFLSGAYFGFIKYRIA